jgi:ATP-dependent RNA circularization protein (DNA/RNA ligase family)
MEKINSYPKVYAIGHPAVADLFADEVLVEEKIDGSQFSFARVGDTLHFRSRGAIIYDDNPEKLFAAAVNNVREIKDRLNDGWVYRAEFLQKPKHNILSYERIPTRNLILFDINTGDEQYLSRTGKEEEAERLGLEIVPVLYRGMVDKPDILLALLDHLSILGKVCVEGIVVKNYARFGKDKKALMGKYVREDFKEVHAREWKAANPSVGDIVFQLIASLRSERRWEKAVERLRDLGELEHSPRDIGKLIKAVQDDIREEETEFIKQKLYEYAVSRIIRGSTAGLPEWYKKRLLEDAFATPDQ